LIAVDPAHTAVFEDTLSGLPLFRLGVVTVNPTLHITWQQQTLIDVPVATLRRVWQQGLEVINVKDTDL
jgi:phosphoribosylformylglycinamidine synthase subunit II (EC 6.3.5.3)